MSKERELYAAIYDLEYNYPLCITTWGNCCIEECLNDARGSGLCASCCEKKIGKIIGCDKTAKLIHTGISKLFDAKSKALRLINE